MYKKLIALVLALALVSCSGAPAFASEEASAVTVSAVSEDPFMPEGTEIPELPPQQEPPADETPQDTPEEPAESEPPQVPEDSDNVEIPEEEKNTEESGKSEDSDKKEESNKTDTGKDTSKDKVTNKDKNTKKETEKEKKARLAAEKYRDGLAAYIRKVNPNQSKSWSCTLAQYFIDAGKKYDLDPKVLMAMAQRESTFRAKVTSPYGYKGMMQTSDSLARSYGYKPSELYNAKVSIDVAARYMKSLKKTFGTYTMAFCGYIYGGYAVQKGWYSKKGAWATMNVRDGIKEFLEKNNYI